MGTVCALTLVALAFAFWLAPFRLAWAGGPRLAYSRWQDVKGMSLQYRHWQFGPARVDTDVDYDGDFLIDCHESEVAGIVPSDPPWVRPGAEGLAVRFGSAAHCVDWQRVGP